MTQSTCIVIMAKQPQAGITKTRLCPPLQPQEAAALYEALLRDSIDLVVRLKNVDLAVAITPAEAEDYFRSITPEGTLLMPVTGADIGACLSQSIQQLLDQGYHKVLAFNADGPSLPPDYLVEAVRRLDRCDVVFGQGVDGGYYLIGLKQPCPQLFTGIAWSTGSVLAQSIEQAGRLGLDIELTPAWYDVDNASDLLLLKSDLNRLPDDRLVHTRRLLEGDRGRSVPG